MRAARRWSARAEAQAFSELELVTAEPITVVMSEKGWIRAAKGHDIDPTSLSYKSGDSFKMAAYGRSNQPVVILDSTGRAYTLPPHTSALGARPGRAADRHASIRLPARLSRPDDGRATQLYLLASDAGYGFVARLGDLQTKNRAGKAVSACPKARRCCTPVLIARRGRTTGRRCQQRGTLAGLPAGGSAAAGARQRQQNYRHSGARGARARRIRGCAVVYRTGHL